MTLFNLYILVGFFYTMYLWYKMTPPEEKVITHVGEVASFTVQAVGASLVWPLVVYVNHIWEGPSE